MRTCTPFLHDGASTPARPSPIKASYWYSGLKSARAAPILPPSPKRSQTLWPKTLLMNPITDKFRTNAPDSARHRHHTACRRLERNRHRSRSDRDPAPRIRLTGPLPACTVCRRRSSIFPPPYANGAPARITDVMSCPNCNKRGGRGADMSARMSVPPAPRPGARAHGVNTT